MDTSGEAELDVACTCSPATVFIGNVILHTSLHVDFQFNLLNWTSEARVEFPSVRIVGIYTLSQYCYRARYFALAAELAAQMNWASNARF